MQDGDAGFVRDGLDRAGPDVGLGVDQGAGILWCPRVADADRDAPVGCRLNRLGMKHPGAEVGELGRFRVGETGDGARSRHDARIGSEDSTHVRPDLDFAGVEGCAHQRGAVVGSTASERGGPPGLRRSDVAAQDGDQGGVEQRHELSAGPALGVSRHRVGPAISRVGDDAAAGIDGVGREPRRREHCREQRGGESLAEGRDLVLECRRLLRPAAQSPEQTGEVAPGAGELLMEARRRVRAEQRLRELGVPIELVVQAPRRAGDVAVGRGPGAREQRVRHPRECGDHDHWPRSAVLAHDARDARTRRCVCDRCTAEFEYRAITQGVDLKQAVCAHPTPRCACASGFQLLEASRTVRLRSRE